MKHILVRNGVNLDQVNPHFVDNKLEVGKYEKYENVIPLKFGGRHIRESIRYLFNNYYGTTLLSVSRPNPFSD